ncbi:MAG TPA: cytochrome C oxidase subunit IV family protein [Gemmataceae bacterium]|nr:cytochrome C oxidase subunit IV family protein [Gemmataceae bacterium]
MTSHAHSTSIRPYVIVWAILICMTILTAAVSFFELGTTVWHLIIALVIATFKASLVILFFMHAASSSRLTWIVIVCAVFFLGILFLLTLTDYMSRDMIPLMPGH